MQLEAIFFSFPESYVRIAGHARHASPAFLREYLSGTGLRPLPYAGATARSAGLGLRIVRRILELHGSRLELLSADPCGTSLRFSLHKAEDEKTLQATSRESSVPAHEREPDIASAA